MSTQPIPFPAMPPSPASRPSDEDGRPRERLARCGVEALHDSELVALILGTGPAGATAVAERLLTEVGGIGELGRCGPSELSRVAGIGAAKAAALVAAFELGRRSCRVEALRRDLLDCPEAAIRYLSARAAGWAEERVGVLLLDTRRRLLADRVIAHGSLDAAAVAPRDVLRAALIIGAAAIVLYHNHPSGDPSPSRDDLDLTRQLAAACRSVGLQLIDHVVVASAGCVSLARRGAIPEGGRALC